VDNAVRRRLQQAALKLALIRRRQPREFLPSTSVSKDSDFHTISEDDSTGAEDSGGGNR
jgi:hypothetical protein